MLNCDKLFQHNVLYDTNYILIHFATNYILYISNKVCVVYGMQLEGQYNWLKRVTRQFLTRGQNLLIEVCCMVSSCSTISLATEGRYAAWCPPAAPHRWPLMVRIVHGVLLHAAPHRWPLIAAMMHGVLLQHHIDGQWWSVSCMVSSCSTTSLVTAFRCHLCRRASSEHNIWIISWMKLVFRAFVK